MNSSLTLRPRSFWAPDLFKARLQSEVHIWAIIEVLYGIPGTVYSTTAVSSRVLYSSSTGITYLRGLTQHTSTDAACIYRPKKRSRAAHSRQAFNQEPSLRRRGGKMRWMWGIDRQEEELWANDELSLGSSLYTPYLSLRFVAVRLCC